MTYATIKPTTPYKPRSDGIRGNRMNWYRRHVRKDMEPFKYYEGADEAASMAGLP